MSMSPSSGKVSMKDSLPPRMLRKCTLKNLPRSPNQRMTSTISSAGIVEHLADRALAEIEAVIGAFAHQHEFLQALDRAENPRHAAIAGRRIGIVRMAGEPDPVRLPRPARRARGNSRCAPSSRPRQRPRRSLAALLIGLVPAKGVVA